MPIRSPPKPASYDSDRSTPPVDHFDGAQNEAPIHKQGSHPHPRGIPRNSSYSSNDDGYHPPQRRNRRDRQQLCHNFQAGHCAFGNRCNFSHAMPNAPPPPSYYEAYYGLDSDPSTPLAQHLQAFPTHYRHDPYSTDAFIFYGDDDVMTQP